MEGNRTGQIVAGTVCILIGAVIEVGPILLFGEQPTMASHIAAGGFAFVGLWLIFPVGMGRLGDWAAEKIPWLHHHEEDDG